MIFTGAIFLFLFLPLVLLVYYVVPVKFKNAVLLFFSLIFYSWGEWSLVVLLLFSTVIDFSAGLIIEKGFKKAGLILSILVNLSLLGYFKYANFTFENYNATLQFLDINQRYLIQLPTIVLPIGISFFTFQTMSYSIDVYRGKIQASKNVLTFATYVTLFPQLVAGPIVRYADIEKQLTQRTVQFNHLVSGIERFIIGFAKKMLIAGTLSEVANNVFGAQYTALDSLTAWIGLLAFTLQIYFDFSAYSDMAIGLGKMFGFDFPENFNYPYTAKSIRDFWRRWHISLSTWFRDYLYISLGGNRNGKLRTFSNLTIVFLATGLWHGATWNFVLWGLFHGFFLILERLFDRGSSRNNFRNVLGWIYTIFVVMLSWVFFRTETFAESLQYFQALAGLNTGDILIKPGIYCASKHWIIGLVALMFCLPVYPWIQRIFQKQSVVQSDTVSGVLNLIYRLGLIVLFLISISYFASNTYDPFIYFRF